MAKAKKEADFAVVTDRVLADWRAARRRLLDTRAAAPAVHDWRICTRQLLALEALLARRSDGDHSPCAMRLQDAFRASGKLRDTQVAIRMLESLRPRNTAATRISRRLRRKLPRSRRSVVREVRGVHTRELRSLAAKGNIPEKSADAPPPAAWRRIASELRALMSASAGSESQDALHQQRLRIKRLRYMLELIGDNAGLPAGAQQALPVLARRQAELGAITDTHVTLERVARAVRKNSRSEEYDALHRQLLRRYQQLLRRQSRRAIALQIARTTRAAV